MELNTNLVDQDLRNQDLRNKDFSGHVLWGASLQGAQLYGAKFDLACHTFDHVGLDDQQVALFLVMLSKADIKATWQSALRALVKSQIGKAKYDVMSRYAEIA